MVRGKPNSHAEHHPASEFRIDSARLSELEAITLFAVTPA